MKKFILIKNVYNLRDLGSYRSKDGSKIKSGKIFRSGKLSEIPESEIDKMKKMNLKSICDFRTTSEQTQSPDSWYHLEKINQYSLPVGEGRMDQPDWDKRANMGVGKNSYLYKANLSYVRENVAQYKSFFKILLDENNYPLLFHCTAGKDRTGFAAVLLLHILGFDRKTIVEDYEDYIQGAFDAITEDYETIDNFLLQALEIGAPEIQQLRDILLED